MRSAKILGGATALIAAALVGGTLIGSVFAAPSSQTTETDDGVAVGLSGEYCETFLTSFATELGTDEAALEAAWRTAMNTAIDAAVEAGDLEAERAEAIKENIAEADLNMCSILAGRPGMVWKEIGERARGVLVRDLVGVAAETLGIENSELVEAFRDGTSLQELADQQEVSYDSVKEAVLAEAQTDLATAVEEGIISQERADATYERLEAWLDEGGEPPAWGRRHRHGPFGPPPSEEGDGSS